MYVVHTLALWNINYAIRCLLRVTALVHLHYKHSFWMTFITGQCESPMYLRVLQMNPASD